MFRTLSSKEPETPESQTSDRRGLLSNASCLEAERSSEPVDLELHSYMARRQSLFGPVSVVHRVRIGKAQTPDVECATGRLGWVQSPISRLAEVPPEGKIALVENEKVVPEETVREKYKTYQKLKNIQWHLRGWTLEVLEIVRKLDTNAFTLDQVYRHEAELLERHPHNRNIRAKIRQQLQFLRDQELIAFLGGGRYRVTATYRDSTLR
jgi:Dam-replacing HTH domain